MAITEGEIVPPFDGRSNLRPRCDQRSQLIALDTVTRIVRARILETSLSFSASWADHSSG
jgi:hypothetical protein